MTNYETAVLWLIIFCIIFTVVLLLRSARLRKQERIEMDRRRMQAAERALQKAHDKAEARRSAVRNSLEARRREEAERQRPHIPRIDGRVLPNPATPDRKDQDSFGADFSLGHLLHAGHTAHYPEPIAAPPAPASTATLHESVHATQSSYSSHSSSDSGSSSSSSDSGSSGGGGGGSD